jgi:hypothetical protein
MPQPEYPQTEMTRPDKPAAYGDDQALAMSLITIWTMRTGRILRPVPVSELTATELVNFWADDQLEPPFATPVCEWPPP